MDIPTYIQYIRSYVGRRSGFATRLGTQLYIQGVAVGDRTYFGIYASKYYGVSLT